MSPGLRVLCRVGRYGSWVLLGLFYLLRGALSSDHYPVVGGRDKSWHVASARWRCRLLSEHTHHTGTTHHNTSHTPTKSLPATRNANVSVTSVALELLQPVTSVLSTSPGSRRWQSRHMSDWYYSHCERGTLYRKSMLNARRG